MKKYYSIGEVASFLGISTQTLRYYDKAKVVLPENINKKNNYRQYTYDQIHYIERVKYLQKLGLGLDEIRNALKDNNVKDMITILKKHHDKIKKQLCELKETEEIIDWYLQYYQHLDNIVFPDIPFKQIYPKRYIMVVPIAPDEPLYGVGGLKLTQMQSTLPFRNLKFLRQNGYILDFQSLMNGKIIPKFYFVYLKEPADFEHPALQCISEGTYFCYQLKLFSDKGNNYMKKYFFKENRDHLVIANEFEDNFKEFKDCTYEMQIQI